MRKKVEGKEESLYNWPVINTVSRKYLINTHPENEYLRQ
jgi:hypothetical protein